MGLASKILAIFNVLAAVGFLALAVMDYGKQRAWTTLIFQENLLIKGLPVEDTEKDVDGEVLATKVGTHTLQQLLGTGGTPVHTQLEEVKKRQSTAKSAIEQIGDDAGKRANLASLLVPLATTYGQREEFKRRIKTEPVDQLLGPDGLFEMAFREAQEGKSVPSVKDPAGGDLAAHTLSMEQRKQAIAHLLFNLGDKPERYDQRLQGVIGLAAFLQEVSNQVEVFKHLLAANRAVVDADLAAFALRHKDLILQIKVEAERIQELRENLQKQEAQRDLHATLVTRRKQDVAQLQEEIAKAAKLTAETLKTQQEIETALDDAKKSIAKTTETNLQLERQIRAREQAR